MKKFANLPEVIWLDIMEYGAELRGKAKHPGPELQATAMLLNQVLGDAAEFCPDRPHALCPWCWAVFAAAELLSTAALLCIPWIVFSLDVLRPVGVAAREHWLIPFWAQRDKSYRFYSTVFLWNSYSIKIIMSQFWGNLDLSSLFLDISIFLSEKK